MEWMWTWEGECFGYRDGVDLYTHFGKHVGRFHGEEIYDRNGDYIGELRNENRLISSENKSHFRKSGFTPFATRMGYVKYMDYVGYVMYLGYKDFPSAESFRN